MTLDSLLVDIGGFGRFQLLVQVSMSFIVMSVSWSMLQMAFSGFIPDWYCNSVDPGDQASAGQVKSNTTKGACHINSSWTLYGERTCQDFQFEGSAVTVITEWDLVCDRKWIQSAVTSIQMGGVLMGAFVCGMLADRFGRKKTLFGFLLFLITVNIITAFSVSWQMFAVLRFFIGVGIGSVLVVYVVYTVEFMPIKWRPFWVLIPSWMIGVCIFAGFASLLKNWSHLQIACGLFGVPGLLGYIYLPESMRWLGVQGRVKEAEDVCRKIASINGKDVPSSAKSVLEKIFHEEQESRQSDRKYSYIDILNEWSVLKVTLTFCFFWFSMSLIYYGMSFGVSSLAGDLYLNIFLLAVVGMPSQWLAFVLMNSRLGRRWTTVMFLCISLASAIGCVVAHYQAPSGIKGEIIKGLSLITQMCVNGSWQGIMQWGLELYPTVTRNLGNGLANAGARVGGILAPFVIDFNDRIAVSYAIIGGLNFICILLCFVNPDTKGITLEDTTAKKVNSMQVLASKKYHANEKEAGISTIEVVTNSGLKDANKGEGDDKNSFNVRF